MSLSLCCIFSCQLPVLITLVRGLLHTPSLQRTYDVQATYHDSPSGMKMLAGSESDKDSENSLEKLSPSERISSNPRDVSMVVLQLCVRVVVMVTSTASVQARDNLCAVGGPRVAFLDTASEIVCSHKQDN